MQYHEIKEIVLKDGRSFVFINNVLIASHNPVAEETEITAAKNWYRWPVQDYNKIIADLKATVANHIAMLKAGTYKAEVINQLPYKKYS